MLRHRQQSRVTYDTPCAIIYDIASAKTWTTVKTFTFASSSAPMDTSCLLSGLSSLYIGGASVGEKILLVIVVLSGLPIGGASGGQRSPLKPLSVFSSSSSSESSRASRIS